MLVLLLRRVHPGVGLTPVQAPSSKRPQGGATRGGRPQGDGPQLLPGMDVIPL